MNGWWTSMATFTQTYVQAPFMIAAAILSLSPSETLAQQRDGAAEHSVGFRLFLSTGCGACHRIAGTEADGKIGPDLTHLASRETIGANLLPMTAEDLTNWIRHTQELKPGARMPAFGMLPVSETNAIVDYLVTLK